MNIQDIIKKIRNSLGLQKELSNEAVLGVLHMLDTLPPEEEISCEELYVKLDEYVEREVSKKDAAVIMPVIREHLDVCSECCEEYEALLNVLNHLEDEKKEK
jgi:hypothetical protein